VQLMYVWIQKPLSSYHLSLIPLPGRLQSTACPEKISSDCRMAGSTLGLYDVKFQFTKTFSSSLKSYSPLFLRLSARSP